MTWWSAKLKLFHIFSCAIFQKRILLQNDSSRYKQTNLKHNHLYSLRDSPYSLMASRRIWYASSRIKGTMTARQKVIHAIDTGTLIAACTMPTEVDRIERWTKDVCTSLLCERSWKILLWKCGGSWQFYSVYSDFRPRWKMRNEAVVLVRAARSAFFFTIISFWIGGGEKWQNVARCNRNRNRRKGEDEKK